MNLEADRVWIEQDAAEERAERRFDAWRAGLTHNEFRNLVSEFLVDRKLEDDFTAYLRDYYRDYP